MKQKILKQEVIDIFQQLSGKTFTVNQALEIYMATPSIAHSDVKLARQYIRRNMLKLIASGDLKVMASAGRTHQYRLTDQFGLRMAESNSTTLNTKTESSIQHDKVKKTLAERLHHQKLMLLTAMGEAEEYDAIYKEMPDIRVQIQELYNESRDRCSKLLGKVKAIENLINISSR